MGAEGLPLVLMISGSLDVVPAARACVAHADGSCCSFFTYRWIACALHGTYFISTSVNRLSDAKAYVGDSAKSVIKLKFN